jgi:hypothetical protein
MSHGCHNLTPEQFHINYNDNNTYIHMCDREREQDHQIYIYIYIYMLLDRLQLHWKYPRTTSYMYIRFYCVYYIIK